MTNKDPTTSATQAARRAATEHRAFEAVPPTDGLAIREGAERAARQPDTLTNGVPDPVLTEDNG